MIVMLVTELSLVVRRRSPVWTLLQTGGTGRVTAGRGTGRAVPLGLLQLGRGLVIGNADLQGLVVVSSQLDRPDVVVSGLDLSTLTSLPLSLAQRYISFSIWQDSRDG